jgi:thiamine kinase-like enzyme
MSAVQELPQDQALPHLARALDERAMFEVFSDAISGQRARIIHCRIDRVKYRPRRNCSVSYLLSLQDDATGSVFEQRVAARVCSAGESASRAVRGGGKQFQSSLAGPTLRLLPDLDMLTWWWPNDAKLSAPGVFSDSRLMREQVLPELAGALTEGCGKLVDYQLEIAQYIPEQRVCARVDVRWSINGAVVNQRVYAKSSREPDSSTVHAILHLLQKSKAWGAGLLRTPRALLWQPSFMLHWQQGLPGHALRDVAPAEAARLAGPLGTQLACLHGTPVALAQEFRRDSLHFRLAEVVQVLAQALPDSRQTLARLSERLIDGLHWLDAAPLVTLHGDLHPCNVLADGDQIALIDLDGLQNGPALLELGAWMAGGMYRALLQTAPPTRDLNAWQSLLDGYAIGGGQLPHPRSLTWAAAWNLLCQRAWRCVVALKPGRLAIAPRLIELAEVVVDAPSLEAV